MARAIEVPVVVKKGSLSRSIEGETQVAMRRLGSSGQAVAPLGRMLGKIRADADEFTKSIEASNARVIAFGASVAVINGISNAFKALVKTTINVEKSLMDINVVLGASQGSLQKFGDGLFRIAKNTAQSFEAVSEAALEFSRQGLSLQETLKRTNDALILTRLTGLKAADSVKGLTAAVNGFGKAGLTTTQIINKLAAVDTQFAVGTDDLINALGRAGAVAQDAGVSFDELVSIVTVAQQRTARGGSVIGNAFKTIYTRMKDPKALQALRSVNIAVDDITGAALPANTILKNLAQSYDGLSRSSKATVDQLVAGKFQINILKSVLGDLSGKTLDYDRALRVSMGATDQAIQKNTQLNKTISALATQSGLALEELATKIGDIAIAPGMKDLLQSFKSIVEGISGVLDGEGAGSKFAQGLLRGIGNVISGPGLVVIGGVFLKLFKDLTVFGVKSLQNLLGLNAASKQQASLQAGIGQLLATNVKYQTAMAAAEGNLARQTQLTTKYLAAEVALRERAATAQARLAAAAYAGGFRVGSAGAVTRRGKIPGFAPTGGTGGTGGMGGMRGPRFAPTGGMSGPVSPTGPRGVPNFAGNLRLTSMARVPKGQKPIGTETFGSRAFPDATRAIEYASPLIVGHGQTQTGLYNLQLGLGKAFKKPKILNAISQRLMKEGYGGINVQTSLQGLPNPAGLIDEMGAMMRNKSFSSDMRTRLRAMGPTGKNPNYTSKEARKVVGKMYRAHSGKQSIDELAGEFRTIGREHPNVINEVRGHYDQMMAERVTEKYFAKELNARLIGGRQGKDTLFDAIQNGYAMEFKKGVSGASAEATIGSIAKKSMLSETAPELRELFRETAGKMGINKASKKTYLEEFDTYIRRGRVKAGKGYQEAGVEGFTSGMGVDEMIEQVKGYHRTVNFAPNFAPWTHLKGVAGEAAGSSRVVGNMFGEKLKYTNLNKKNLEKAQDFFSGASLGRSKVGQTKTFKSVKFLLEEWLKGWMIGLPTSAFGLTVLQRAIGIYGKGATQKATKGIGNLLSGNLKIPGFSPLSNAIVREKHQVGAMMGISPSSVQTKTIQNASLRSSFNPQGFGVISPTVGQNTFADAAKMHRGENLKTVNLPHFGPKGTRPHFGPKGTRLNPLTGLYQTPTGYSRAGNPIFGGLTKTGIDDMAKAVSKGNVSASKLLGGAGTAGRALPFMGVAGMESASISNMVDDIVRAGEAAAAKTAAPPPKAGRLARVGKAMGTGLGAARAGIGGALMSPVGQMAMFAPFIHQMIGGFIEAPTPEERFFQTPEQRRRDPKGITMARHEGATDSLTAWAAYGGGAALIGDIALTVLSIIGPKVTAAAAGGRVVTGIRAGWAGLRGVGAKAGTRFGPAGRARASVAAAEKAGGAAGMGGTMPGQMLRRGGYGAAIGAAVGYGGAELTEWGMFGPTEGKPFLDKEEFMGARVALTQRSRQQSEAISGIHDAIAIAGDIGRTENQRYAANIVINQSLAGVKDTAARGKIATILADPAIKLKDKQDQVVRIQADLAKKSAAEARKYGGVQAITRLFEGGTDVKREEITAGLAGMGMGMTEPDRKRFAELLYKKGGIGTPTTGAGGGVTYPIGGAPPTGLIATRSKIGGLGTAGEQLQDDASLTLLKSFQETEQGYGSKTQAFVDQIIQGQFGTGILGGANRTTALSGYLEQMVELMDLVDADADMRNQIFKYFMFNKKLIEGDAEEMKKAQVMINDMLKLSKRTIVPAKIGSPEFKDYLIQLQKRRGLEDRLFEEGVMDTRRLNQAERAYGIDMGGIAAMGSAGLTAGPTAARRGGVLERKQFETRAGGRKRGIVRGATGKMGTIFGDPSPGTRKFDIQLRRLLEEGDTQGVLDILTNIQTAGGQIDQATLKQLGVMRTGMRSGQTMQVPQADTQAMQKQIAIIRETREALRLEKENTDNQRKNLDIRLKLLEQEQENLKTGLAAGRAIDIRQAQISSTGRIAGAQLSLDQGRMAREEISSPFMTVNQQRDLQTRMALSQLTAAEGVVRRGAESETLGLAAGFAGKFGTQTAAMTQDAGRRPAMAMEGASLQAAQENFDRALTNLIEGGNVTSEAVQELAGKFFSAIGDPTSPEAQDAVRDFTVFIEQLQTVAAEKKLKITDIVELKEATKEADAFRTLKDVTDDFGNAFESAMLKVSRSGGTASDALRNFGIAFFSAINARAVGNIADMVSGSLFDFGKDKGWGKKKGKQRGGIIRARSGMYISGDRTGDKNLALLEDGEYVLNRNLVKQMGGPSMLDTLNFGMAPRFQGGGRSRFGGTPGRGKSYPRKFFDAGPLTLNSGQNVLDSSEFLNPSRFTDDVVVINPDGKIAPLPKLDFSKKLRYSGRSSMGLHMTEKDVSGKAKHYTFKKDGEGGFLSSHGISIGDIRWPGTDAIEIDAIRGGKNILVGKQGGGFLGGIGKGLTLPFRLIIKLLSSIFGGGRGGEKESFLRGVPKGSSRQAESARTFVDIEKGIKQLEQKEATLGKGIASWGAGVKDYARPLAGAELGETWRVILGLGKRQGGKEAMKHYDSQVKFHGLSAFDKLIGADDKPMGRSGMIDILKRSGVRGFQSGGRLVSPISQSGVSTKGLNEILDKYGAPPPISGPGAVSGGGGGAGRLGILDPRLSGFAHSNDPTLQNVRGDVRDWHQEQIQKKFEKQAKRDELMKTIVGAFVSAGLQAGVGGIKGMMTKTPKGTPTTTLEDWGGFRYPDRAMEGMTNWDKFKLGFKGVDPKTGRGWQSGGSIDNIPALLTGGEFVVNSPTVRKYGSSFFNRFQEGGLVGDQKFVPAEKKADGGRGEAGAKTGDTNTTINITVNSSSGEGGSTEMTGEPGQRERELAVKIRTAVVAVMKQEKRTGGMLRDVT